MKKILSILCAFSILLSLTSQAAELELDSAQPSIAGQARVDSNPKPFASNSDESAVYIIRLQDPAVATYTGGVSGLAATNPAALGTDRLDVNAAPSVWPMRITYAINRQRS